MATGTVLHDIPPSSHWKNRRPRTTGSRKSPEVTVDNFVVTPRFLDTLKKYKKHPNMPSENLLINENHVHDHTTQNVLRNVPRCSGRVAKSNSAPRNCSEHGYIPAKDPEKFYLTSNRRDFVGLQGSPAPSARCISSTSPVRRGACFPDVFAEGTNIHMCNMAKSAQQVFAIGSDRIHQDFMPGVYPLVKICTVKNMVGNQCLKKVNFDKGLPLANGKNNPHPLEAFLIWRFPGKIPNVDQLHNITDEAMHDVCKEKLRSTYEVDYTGSPQGVQTQTVYEGYPTSKVKEPPYTLDSTTRFDYQPPLLQRDLRNNISRYGCNGRKWQPALGAVPTVSELSPFLQVHSSTHYKKEFKDKFAELPVDSLVKPNVLPVVQDYIRRAKPEDQQVIQRLLEAMDIKKEADKPLERLSDWAGPR